MQNIFESFIPNGSSFRNPISGRTNDLYRKFEISFWKIFHGILRFRSYFSRGHSWCRLIESPLYQVTWRQRTLRIFPMEIIKSANHAKIWKIWLQKLFSIFQRNHLSDEDSFVMRSDQRFLESDQINRQKCEKCVEAESDRVTHGNRWDKSDIWRKHFLSNTPKFIIYTRISRFRDSFIWAATQCYECSKLIKSFPGFI